MRYIWIFPGLLITYYTGSYGIFLWKKKQKKASIGVFLQGLACIFLTAVLILNP